jgi:uncharacterized membrane protein
VRRAASLPLTLLGLVYPLTVYLGFERLDRPPPAIGVLALGLPMVVSLGLGAVFALSLRRGQISLVGRLARAQRGMTWLPATAEAYCRKVTAVWCAFFVGNAATAGVLALFAPLGWWAAYTGVVAYLLAGLLMGFELLYRRVRVEPRVLEELARTQGDLVATGETSQ